MDKDNAYYLKKHIEAVLGIRGLAPEKVRALVASLQAMNTAVIKFNRVTAPPQNPVVGMVAWPDGTSWNPLGDGGIAPVHYNGTEWSAFGGGMVNSLNELTGALTLDVDGYGTIVSEGDTITITINEPPATYTIGNITNHGVTQDGQDELAALLTELFGSSSTATAGSFNGESFMQMITAAASSAVTQMSQETFNQLISGSTVVNAVNGNEDTPTYITINQIGVNGTPSNPTYINNISKFLELIIDNSNDVNNPTTISPVIIQSPSNPAETIEDYIGQQNPMTTLGDTIYGGASGVQTRLAGNTTATRKFMLSVGDGSDAAAPSWSTVTKSDVGLGSVENTALSTWAGSTNLTTLGTIGTGTWNATTIGVSKGGTGLTTFGGAYTLLYTSSANTLVALSNGTDGKVLTAHTGAAPTWEDPTAGSVASDTIWDALGDVAYGTGANTGAVLSGNTTTTRKFLRQTGNGAVSAAPAWDTLTSGDVTAALGYTPETAGAGVPVGGVIMGETASDAVIVAGGYTDLGADYHNIVRVGKVYTQLTDLSVSRGFAGCAWDGSDLIYAVGGENNTGAVTSGEAYSISGDSWSAITALGTARSGIAAGYYNGKLYIAGGSNPSTYLKKVQEYDPVATTWADKASSTNAHAYSAWQVYGTKIYLLGGSTASNTYTTSCESYDMSSNTWASLTAMPQSLDLTSSVLVGDKIYVAGGRFSTTNVPFFTTYFYVYDITNGTWAALQVLPELSSWGTIAYDGVDTIYLMNCFYDSPSSSYQVSTFGTLAYSITEDTWEILAKPLTSHHQRSGVSVPVGSDYYFIGGTSKPMDGSSLRTTATFFTPPTTKKYYLYEKT